MYKDKSIHYLHLTLLPSVRSIIHRPDSWEFLYVVKGAGVCTCQSQPSLFVSGDLALLPPAVDCRYQFSEAVTDGKGQAEYISLCIAPSFLEALTINFPEFTQSVQLFLPTHQTIRFSALIAAAIAEELVAMSPLSDAARLPHLLRLLSLLPDVG